MEPGVSPHDSRTSGEDVLRAPARRVQAFVLVVSLCGVAVLIRQGTHLFAAPLNAWVLVLAILTVVSGRFVIKVPGYAASVTVSEIFLFASIVLFGPAPATITVALDGLWTSATQETRRLYRAAFNIAEPAVSTCVAGWVFFAVAGVEPLAGHGAGTAPLTLAAVAMSSTYFFLNSALQAIAVALESGVSPLQVWKQHALYLALNYYAAGSLATLAVKNSGGLDLDMVGLIAPLLILSYGAYKASASRIDDAQQHVKEVEHLYEATIEMMAIAVDAKDQVTHGHIRRVQRHTLAMAKKFGITAHHELKALEAASLLHDIGKLAVPDYVLNKPGALSRTEFDTMKLHVEAGTKILGAVDFPYPVVPIVRGHHEQWCGKGYPDGIAGESIPIGARILSVVDCFDAITSDRPYRRKMTDEEALGVLRERRGTMYDPQVVDAFVEMVPSLRAADREAEVHLAAGPVFETVHAVADVMSQSGNQLINPRELDTVAWMMQNRLADLDPHAEACFFVHDPDTDVLSVVRSTERLRHETANLQVRVGEGLAGWVASNRHTIVNSNADLDLGPMAKRLDLGPCTATPVFVFGKIVGVLTAYLPSSRKFVEDDVKTVGLLAQDIGTVLARERRRRPRTRPPIELAKASGE